MPDPVLGAGHPVVNTETTPPGTAITVNPVDAHDEMIRLETPKRRDCEVEGTSPHTEGSGVDQRWRPRLGA